MTLSSSCYPTTAAVPITAVDRSNSSCNTRRLYNHRVSPTGNCLLRRRLHHRRRRRHRSSPRTRTKRDRFARTAARSSCCPNRGHRRRRSTPRHHCTPHRRSRTRPPAHAPAASARSAVTVSKRRKTDGHAPPVRAPNRSGGNRPSRGSPATVSGTSPNRSDCPCRRKICRGLAVNRQRRRTSTNRNPRCQLRRRPPPP